MHPSQWNAETIGIWGCNFFTVVEGFGLISQITTIWRKRSGASVSVGMVLFLSALSVAAIIYGTSYHRLPVVFNGLVLGVGFAVVSFELWKFKGFQRWEMWFGASLVVAVAFMIVSAHQDRWYFLFNIGAGLTLILQPLEIWKKRSAGVVDIRLLTVFFASSLFWCVYAFAVRDWVLMVLSPANLIILGSTIALWWFYRPRAS